MTDPSDQAVAHEHITETNKTVQWPAELNPDREKKKSKTHTPLLMPFCEGKNRQPRFYGL